MYVLDEPSIGLHQRDNDRLLETLIHLRNLGNTVIVVEHDEDAIRAADHIIDIGRARVFTAGKLLPGITGGYYRHAGFPDGKFLSGERRISIRKNAMWRIRPKC